MICWATTPASKHLERQERKKRKLCQRCVNWKNGVSFCISIIFIWFVTVECLRWPLLLPPSAPQHDTAITLATIVGGTCTSMTCAIIVLNLSHSYYFFSCFQMRFFWDWTTPIWSCFEDDVQSKCYRGSKAVGVWVCLAAAGWSVREPGHRVCCRD